MKNLISSLTKQERLDVALRVQTQLFNAPWAIMVTSTGTKRLREMYSLVNLIVRWSTRETSK